MPDLTNIQYGIFYYPGLYDMWSEHASYDTTEEAEEVAARLRLEHPNLTIHVDDYDPTREGTWVWPLTSPS